MQRLLFTCSLFVAVNSACITTIDVGVDGDSGGQGGSAESTATASGSASASSGAASSSGQASASSFGPGSTGQGTTGASETTDGTSESGVSASTFDTDSAGPEDDEICDATGGTWHPDACGHYGCGQPQDCRAVEPGCDCGFGRSFVPGIGCEADETCPASVAFDCLPGASCNAPDAFCDFFVPPGPKGPVMVGCEATPAACLDDYSCDCFEAAGLLEDGALCEVDENLGSTRRSP